MPNDKNGKPALGTQRPEPNTSINFQQPDGSVAFSLQPARRPDKLEAAPPKPGKGD